MARDADKLLFDMLQAGRNIGSFVTGRTEAGYIDDPMLSSAVERQLFIFAEALTQLRKASPEVAEQIPDSHLVIGFRNLLAHAYFAVDSRRVWDIVVNHLPATLSIVETLLSEKGI